MKRGLFLLAMALAMNTLFSGCSSDDDSIGAVSGIWNLISYTGAISGAEEIPNAGNETGCPKDYYEFGSAGVFKEGDYYNAECSLNISTGAWTQNGNKLTVSNNTPQQFTIVKLNDTTMKLRQATEDENSIDIVYTFTKATF